MTDSDKALVEFLIATHRNRDEVMALDLLPEAASTISRLTVERDEAQDRVEELEAEQEILSAEFEKDCWKAMRSLLLSVGFDDFSEGVTAEDAREVIAEALDNCSAQDARSRARAEAAEAEAVRLRGVVEMISRMKRDIDPGINITTLSAAIQLSQAALTPPSEGE